MLALPMVCSYEWFSSTTSTTVGGGGGAGGATGAGDELTFPELGVLAAGGGPTTPPPQEMRSVSENSGRLRAMTRPTPLTVTFPPVILRQLFPGNWLVLSR